jgi:o-succinylbenzoate---CoA ligase
VTGAPTRAVRARPADLEPLPVPAGPDVLPLLPRLARALEGGAPILPYAASSPPPDVPPHEPADLPEGLAVVIGTSGSTGRPKRAMLTALALRASARATHDRLGGPGQWLLPLPAHHVAGLQVLLRSVDAGTVPVVLDLVEGFTAEAFCAAVARLDPAQRRYTSLVPTQLLRVLDHPSGPDALGALDAVLVGGAGLPATLRARASEAGVTLLATYGMSETAGGCVYDGRPLDGTRVALADDGRVSLGGATLAHGYLGDLRRTAESFSTDAHGIRWFRTDDVGHRDADGRLHVDGRLDDVVNTGGLKVAPRLVEDAITAQVPEVAEAVVVGTPHAEWGQAVSVLLVLRPGVTGAPPTVADLRSRLRGILPAHALPLRVVVADAVPLRGPGKPDRRAVATLFTVGE